MADNTIREAEFEIPALNKKILVQVPANEADDKALSLTCAFIDALIKNDSLRDTQAGLNPEWPTHQVTRYPNGRYRLDRLGSCI